MSVLGRSTSRFDDRIDSFRHGVNQVVDVLDVQFMVPNANDGFSECGLVNWLVLSQLSANHLPAVLDRIQVGAVARPGQCLDADLLDEVLHLYQTIASVFTPVIATEYLTILNKND